jgi:hypothetical protein
VRLDCTRWQTELASAIPTVIVEASDEAGRDVTPLRVFVDGEALAGYVDGRPFEVDPGPHDLRVEAKDRVSQQSVVAREGEKDRVIPFTLPVPASPLRPAPVTPAPPDAPTRPIPSAAWVLGGVALVGAGAFAAFGYIGLHKHDELRSSCAPSCSDAQVAPVRTDYLIGDISLGVSVLCLGAATWLFITRPTVNVPRTAGVVAWIGPLGGGMQGTF